MLSAHFFFFFFALPVLPFAPATAADVYPSRPIHLIVPYSTGGNADIQGRYVCAGFGEAARYALPEAARRSCYQGDLAVEAEVVEYAH